MSDITYNEMESAYKQQCLIAALKEKVVDVLSKRIGENIAIYQAKQLAEDKAYEHQYNLNAEFYFDAEPASTFEPNNPKHQNCLDNLKKLANIEEE